MKSRYVIAACLCAPASMSLAEGPPPSPVAVEKIETRSITPTMPVSGTVFSRNDVQVTAGVDGQLVRVLEPGETVKKGDVIAQIDTTPLLLQIEEQQALAERAKAQVKYQGALLSRQRGLTDRRAISASELEETQSNLDIARSEQRVAAARIRQLRDQVQRCSMRAPFDGVVIERSRRGGEEVLRGTLIARFVDLSSVEIRALVPLEYARNVAPRDRLRIFGYQTQFDGTVRSIFPAADPRTQTFEVRLDLDEEARSAWTVGQLVSVAVPTRRARRALAVPRDALILRQEGYYVFRVRDDDTAERIPIRVEDGVGTYVAVKGNLSEGDRVVIRGAETLSDGSPVKAERTATN